jgi:uncharacterized membrane protein YdjX (TVP38/TMEM64 family)
MYKGETRQGKKKTARLVKPAILLVFVITVIVSVKLSGLEAYLDKQRLQAWIQGFGAWGPLVYIVFYFFAPSLFLPGLPITIAGGVLFGPLWGVLYTIVGATGGACLAFVIARYFGRDWVSRKVEGTRLGKLDGEVERQGWKIVAFTRLVPLFPFNLLNYAFGLTKVKFSHYALTSFICMLPATVAYIIFSSSLLDLVKGKVSVQLVVGIVLVIMVSLIPIHYRKAKQKKFEGPGFNGVPAKGRGASNPEGE